jgi:hypothetical protein
MFGRPADRSRAGVIEQINVKVVYTGQGFHGEEKPLFTNSDGSEPVNKHRETSQAREASSDSSPATASGLLASVMAVACNYQIETTFPIANARPAIFLKSVFIAMKDHYYGFVIPIFNESTPTAFFF